MKTTRLEAFSDGVLAIIITIMVLELKVPHGADLSSLREVVPHFIAYIVSFVFIGIYWNNHHHLLHATERVGGAVLWANSHLLFWLSLVPAATAWIGENPRSSWPAALYGTIFLGAAVAYTILLRTIIAFEGPQSTLASAVGSDRKGKVSLALYISAIPLAFIHPWISDAIYALVAGIWLAPDPRIETRLQPSAGGAH